MNGIGMVLKQIPLTLPNTQTTDSTGHKSIGFRQLLSTKIETAQELTTDTGLTKPETTSRMNPLNMFMSDHQNRLDGLLVDEGVGDELTQALSNVEVHNNVPEEMLEYLESLFGDDTMSADELLERLNELDAYSEMLEDRKSTRLNSSHVAISYAVFC